MVKMGDEIKSAYVPLKRAIGYGQVVSELREYGRRMGDGGDTCG